MIKKIKSSRFFLSLTRGAVNREKERERSSYLGGEGGGLVVRQENSFLVGEKLLEWMKLEK